MNAKKILAVLVTSAAFMSTALAAGVDDELSIMAAEQRRDAPSDVEATYDQPPVVEKPIEKTVVEKPIEKPAPTIETAPVEPPAAKPPSVTTTNPVQSFGSFEELAEELGYIPLYVPKGTGYALNYMAMISGTVGELRYSRRWETEVNLVVRTYKRPVGEELRDISGINGVKWRVDLSGGTPIYLARVGENSNAAAWAIGQYTFAAMAENLSFAAFRTLVFDELADLSSHYFIEVD